MECGSQFKDTHTHRGRVKRSVLSASATGPHPWGLISGARVADPLMAGIITLGAQAVCRGFCHRFIITLIAEHLAMKQRSLPPP